MYETVRLKAKHPATYRPQGCEDAALCGVVWNTEHERMAYLILYDNGFTDCVPAQELGVLFDVTNKRVP